MHACVPSRQASDVEERHVKEAVVESFDATVHERLRVGVGQDHKVSGSTAKAKMTEAAMQVGLPFATLASQEPAWHALGWVILIHIFASGTYVLSSRE